MPPPPAVHCFDAYGTLFDVAAAAARHAPALGPAWPRLAELWRAKQLEYAWTRSLMGAPYRDFEALTALALDHAAALALGAPLAPDRRAALLDAYAELDAYPDARPLLAALRRAGARTAILSNGSPAMLARAVAAAGLGPHLDAVLSVDALGVFKTHPSTYALVTARFGCAPGEVLFHSSNRWDAAGAARHGFRTVWVNRAGLPDEYEDLPPERVAGSLSALMP